MLPICRLADEWAAIKSPAQPGNDGWNVDVAAGLGAAPSFPTSRVAPVQRPGSRLLRPGCPLLPPDSHVLKEAEDGAKSGRPALPRWMQLGPWERQSQALQVGAEAKQALRQLLPFFKAEVEALGDSDMQQDVDLLQKLVAA